VLGIVTTLDSYLNNTSLILLFEVNGKKFLFPGDAQLENWSWALGQPGINKLLKDVTPVQSRSPRKPQRNSKGSLEHVLEAKGQIQVRSIKDYDVDSVRRLRQDRTRKSSINQSRQHSEEAKPA
jgi:hypothetical protein